MAVRKPYTLWLMGPTSGGKSTIADNFTHILTDNHISVLHYDGDEIRDFLAQILVSTKIIGNHWFSVLLLNVRFG